MHFEKKSKCVIFQGALQQRGNLDVKSNSNSDKQRFHAQNLIKFNAIKKKTEAMNMLYKSRLCL